ncbi:DNA-directed RNA polymerase [Candidatus Woesearchaeota archaeon]|nr:DNA-directed RNA polymerase [Candidatus Woesearchaeota archaeon]
MGEFGRGGQGGPRRDFGGGRGGGGFRSGGGGFRGGPREMHKAVCSECGQECEVPFKPSGDKPVFCKECYRKRREQQQQF